MCAGGSWARLYGQAPKLHGLFSRECVRACRRGFDASLEMIGGVSGPRRITVAGDKGFDTERFVQTCRALNATPHVAMNITKTRTTNLDGRTVNHPGYTTSQRIRKRIEEIFGWIKTTGNLRRTRFKGIARTYGNALLADRLGANATM